MARKRAASRFLIQVAHEAEDGGSAWRDLNTRKIDDTADGLKYLKEAKKPGLFRVIAVKAERTVKVEKKAVVTLIEPPAANAEKKAEGAAAKGKG